jgi:hypothetical protein
MRAALPRLVAARSPLAAAGNLAGLLLAALAGASLVHLAAYHLPFSVPLGPLWVAQALALLAHCPLIGPLGCVALGAALAIWRAAHELRRLEHLKTALARSLAARRGVVPRPCTHDLQPRSLRRLVFFISVLLGLQLLVLAVAMWLFPMHITMRMNGVLMAMPMAPTVPVLPLHLLIAGLLGLLLWRLERRLTGLRAEVHHLSLLGRSGSAGRLPQPIPVSHVAQPLPDHALFARPRRAARAPLSPRIPNTIAPAGLCRWAGRP